MCAIHVNGARCGVCVCVCVCVYALSSHFLFNTMHLRTGHYVPLQVIGLSLSLSHLRFIIDNLSQR